MNPQFQNTLPPPPTKRPVSRFTPKIVLIVIGGIIALIIAISLMVLSGGNSPTNQMQRLSARFDSLQTILESGRKNVQGADLKKVHADAYILIIGDAAQVNRAMTTAGLEKIPKDIIALEADTATLATLADAQLNGRFDTAYKKALSQKLESTMALMREIDGKTNSTALKTSLSTAYDHFGGLLDQLAKL
ncbi:hypothetical protein H7Y40_00600 [Pedobacter sp.]|nr:hypothetical protein [Candidatus Saccharibacteria bacterium]